MLYEVLKTAKMGAGKAPDLYTAIMAQKMPFAKGSGAEHEYTGAVPVTFTANGQPLLDYLISGNTVQSGTPTPDSCVMPQGTGERTGNLFDINATPTKYSQSTTVTVDGRTLTISGAWYIYYEIDVAPNTGYYVDWTIDYAEIQGRGAIAILTTSGQIIKQQDLRPFRFNSGENQRIRLYIYSGNNEPTTVILSNIMLNAGSEALPYEPYGYKIPISSANTTTPVYLGEVQSTRRIKKLVLTGEENWAYEESYSRFWISVADFTTLGLRSTPFMSNAFSAISDGRPIADVPDNTIYSGATGGVDAHKIFIKCTTYTTLNDWESYLAAQYAAGTPVTVWYVLATPETAVVNEPLQKIGDYADTVSMGQAEVQIPTAKGSTTLDVETTVKPSEVYIKYKS